MKAILAALLGLGFAASSGVAMADPDKDESGKGRERGGYTRFDYGYPGRGYGSGGERRFDVRDFRSRDRGYGYRDERRERRASKQEFWDGNCKVERKWDGDEYKEERKCKGGRRGGYPTYGYRY